jgi:hypothetical protein
MGKMVNAMASRTRRRRAVGVAFAATIFAITGVLGVATAADQDPGWPGSARVSVDGSAIVPPTTAPPASPYPSDLLVTPAARPLPAPGSTTRRAPAHTEVAPAPSREPVATPDATGEQDEAPEAPTGGQGGALEPVDATEAPPSPAPTATRTPAP